MRPNPESAAGPSRHAARGGAMRCSLRIFMMLRQAQKTARIETGPVTRNPSPSEIRPSRFKSNSLTKSASRLPGRVHATALLKESARPNSFRPATSRGCHNIHDQARRQITAPTRTNAVVPATDINQPAAGEYLATRTPMPAKAPGRTRANAPASTATAWNAPPLAVSPRRPASGTKRSYEGSGWDFMQANINRRRPAIAAHPTPKSTAFAKTVPGHPKTPDFSSAAVAVATSPTTIKYARNAADIRKGRRL